MSELSQRVKNLEQDVEELKKLVFPKVTENSGLPVLELIETPPAPLEENLGGVSDELASPSVAPSDEVKEAENAGS